MSSPLQRNCCENCEHLRVDNYCLVKEKYILTKNVNKKRDCEFFLCKNHENTENRRASSLRKKGLLEYPLFLQEEK